MSDVRDALLDAAGKAFAAVADLQRGQVSKAPTWLAEGWAAVEDMGLPLALVDERHGGFGIDPLEGLLIIRRAGAHALPLPLVECMIANWMMVSAGLDIRPGVWTIPCADPGDRLELAAAPNGWRVKGRLGRVPWARFAQGVVAVAGLEQRLVCIPQQAWVLSEGSNLAEEPRDDLEIDAVVSEDSVGASISAHHHYLRSVGAAVRAILIAGALERVLEMCIQYVGDRVQFGKTLSKFQVIQQYSAIVAGHVAAAGAAADIAAEALCSDLSPFKIGIAKIRAGEAASAVAALAHQIHGAIGITAEYELQLFTRRLWSWRDEFGSEAEWSRGVGAEVLAGGADALWPAVTAV